MSRKVRQLKADLRREGFSWEPAKGSHTKLHHPLLPDEEVVLSGNDGDDALKYQERQLRKALSRLREIERAET